MVANPGPHELRAPGTAPAAWASWMRRSHSGRARDHLVPTMRRDAQVRNGASAQPGWDALATVAVVVGSQVAVEVVLAPNVLHRGHFRAGSGSPILFQSAAARCRRTLVAPEVADRGREMPRRQRRRRGKSPATPSATQHPRRPLLQRVGAAANKWRHCTRRQSTCFLSHCGAATAVRGDHGPPDFFATRPVQ